MSMIHVLILLGLIATVGALIAGEVSMAHGGRFDEEHADDLMWLRVGLQAFTVFLIGLAILFW